MKAKFRAKLKRVWFPSSCIGWEIKRGKDNYVFLLNAFLQPVSSTSWHLQTAKSTCILQHPLEPGKTWIHREWFNYCQPFGDLRELTDTTPPDLSFATAKLTTASHSPADHHFFLFKATRQYIRAHQDRGLSYQKSQDSCPTVLAILFTDPDCANDRTDLK